MSRAKNTIKLSDISSTPIKVFFSASYVSQSLQDSGITTNRGTNITSYIGSSLTSKKRLTNYRLVRQLYYQNYLTGSVIGSASYWDPSLQSTAASGSLDDDFRYFPNAVSSQVSFLAIPTIQFGEQIKRKSVVINSTQNLYKLIDDGNGNLVDALANDLHVGNVLYAQGIITITNSDYVLILANNTFSFVITPL